LGVQRIIAMHGSDAFDCLCVWNLLCRDVVSRFCSVVLLLVAVCDRGSVVCLVVMWLVLDCVAGFMDVCGVVVCVLV
jgi:hypothetical protein